MDNGLAHFQEAAVARIVERLADKGGSRRFLLADEVGLGKTRVAAAVIRRMSHPKQKGFTVVYVCSNSEIAEQNREKLCADTQSAAVTRLTLLATASADVDRRRQNGELQLFSFTPGTSFHVGGATGIERERRLLLYLLVRIWRKRVNQMAWRNFFCCSCKKETWEARSKFRQIRREFARRIAGDLQQRLKQEWNNYTVQLLDPSGKPSANSTRLSLAIDNAVAAFAVESNPVTRKNRNIIIGALRHCLSRVALEFLQADLVVLDEFQRFSEILNESGKSDSIVGRLFSQRGVATLILSATPYKMYTLSHEAEDHHKDFIRTLKFLFNEAENGSISRNTDKIHNLQQNLQSFKKRLMQGKWFSGPDEELINLKAEIERDLKLVMCRTERNWYLEDRRKGVEEFGINPVNIHPSAGELNHYIRLRHFLLQHKIDDWNITDFWKSAPSPLSFMDGHYALIKRLRDRHVQVPEHLLRTGSDLFTDSKQHLKFRTLAEKVLGHSDKKFPFLWIKPSYTYHLDDFYREEDPAKFLIFSHWKFVPKAISVLLSHEAEKRLGNRRRGRETLPLQFRQKISFSHFDVCYPSPLLADAVNPAALALAAGRPLTAAELYAHAERSLAAMLASCGIARSRTQTVPMWRIVARLEAKSKWAQTIAAGLRKAEVIVRDERSEQYRHYRQQYSRWMDQSDEQLSISPKWLRRLTLICLHSPAICLLRSMRSVFADVPCWEENNWGEVLNVGLNQLRNYFNKHIVQTVIRSHRCRERSYGVKVLDYCGRAHFQAVMDEYAYLLRTALPGEQLHKLPRTFLVHVGRVLGMGTGSPSVNVLTRTGRIRQRPSPRPAHFAVAFGDDVSTETVEAGGRTRKTAMREAFNSPFWPFVLATTSVGQEGLDFHLYCRDVMHWNLPSNPVDLEQREGRINRFDGLSIRRSIVKDHDLSMLKTAPAGGLNIWSRVFETLKTLATGTQRFKHGLYPHWIYQPSDSQGQSIRRHLALYSKSRDTIRYSELKVALSLYRLVFGQPRQQDIIESLLKMFPNADPTEVGKKLSHYTINLSPVERGHATRLAKEEARVLAQDPKKLSMVMAEVRRLLERESGCGLQSALTEIHHLLQLAAGEILSHGAENKRIRAIEGLLYLLNPYDDVYDFHAGIGYRDDVAYLRQVYASLSPDNPTPTV